MKQLSFEEARSLLIKTPRTALMSKYNLGDHGTFGIAKEQEVVGTLDRKIFFGLLQIFPCKKQKLEGLNLYIPIRGKH